MTDYQWLLTNEQILQHKNFLDAVVSVHLERMDVLAVRKTKDESYFVIGTRLMPLKQYVSFRVDEHSVADIAKVAKLEGYGFQYVIVLEDNCPVYEVKADGDSFNLEWIGANCLP